MSTGIKIDNSKDIKIMGCGFSDLETGIDVTNSDDVFVDGAKFHDVGTGLKAKNVRGLKVINSAETSSSPFRLSTSAQLVRWYIELLIKGS